MKEFDPTDEDYNLWLFLAQVRAVMFKARQKEVSRYGITAGQASVLFVINALGDRATPAEISRWLFLKSHSVSAILNRMEKQGLVKRAKDLPKKNLVRVALTEEGRELYGNCTKRESMHKIMASLDSKLRQQLMVCLEKLRDATLKYLEEEREMPFPY